jgi:hypothetical protein
MSRDCSIDVLGKVVLAYKLREVEVGIVGCEE